MSSLPPTIRPLLASDHAATAHLLHRSLVDWYQSRLNQGARFGDSPAPCPHIVLAANAKPHLWWTTNPQLFGPGSEQLDHSGYNYPYPP